MLSKSFKFNMLLFVCAISNLSYYPIFVGIAPIRYAVIGLWVLLGMAFLKKTIILNHTEQIVILLYLLFCFVSMLSFYLGNARVFDNHFFQPVTIALIIFVAGNMMGEEFNQKDIELLCRWYMYVMSFIAVLLFIFYLSGTDIYDRIYGYKSGKNEIAVLLVCALAIAMTLYKPQRFLQYIFQIGAIAFFVIDIFLLKCRSVMLAIAPMILLAAVLKRGMNKKFRFLLITALAVGTIYLFVNQEALDILMNQFIFANRDSTSLDSLSSGRLEQMAKGWNVFLENSFIGVGKIDTLDCMYISALANYGMFALPLIFLALSPLIWGVRELVRTDEAHRSLMACFLYIAVAMITVSVFEEIAPFGPGTRCYILWLLFGILLGYKNHRAASHYFTPHGKNYDEMVEVLTRKGFSG